MVDVWSRAQAGKMGFKNPLENFLPKNNKKDEQWKADSSLTDEKKTEQPSSFQWTENLLQDAANKKQEKLDKLKTDENFKKQQIDKFNSDPEKASVWNSWELWYKQTLKSIWNDWKKSNQRTESKKEIDIEKAKEDDWKVWFWEYLWIEAKDTLRKWINGVKNVVSTVFKWVWWWLDYVWDAVKDLEYMNKVWWEWTRTAEEAQKLAKEAKQERINKLLTKDIEEEDTVKEVATERSIQNATIMQWKTNEVESAYNEYTKESDDFNNIVNETAKKVAEAKWVDEDTAKQMVLFDINTETWAVSWPERDTDYLATVKALKNKKISLEDRSNLFYKKLEEYDEMQREHQLKEYELSPYTDNYYESETDAARYKELFWDKLYKNEDWTLYWMDDQKEKDIKSILKWLERSIFSEAEWVRDETRWKVSTLFWRWEEYNWIQQEDFLKNSEVFLNQAYNVFSNLKQVLEENYDDICDTVTNWAWEQVKVINTEKAAALLKNNKAGLAGLSDYIIEAKSWTEYMDVKLWRYLDGDEWKLTTMRKDLWWLADLLRADTESISREWAESRRQNYIFTYDRARDWVNMASDNYWFRDQVRYMTMSNPAKTAYVAGSSYFAVFGKAQWAVKWKSVLGSFWKMTVWKWKYISTAEWITKSLDSTKWLSKIWWTNQFVQKTVDAISRKWLWVLDEAFVSLPLDLWLNDWSEQDLKMNIFFNALGWLGKIQSLDDLHLMERTVVNQWSPEAMKKYFAEATGLPELADSIKREVWDNASLIKMMQQRIDSHLNNIIKSDKNVAAWMMSQTLAKNIDGIKRENLDEVDALTRAITENWNIWASLSKNRSKNIQKILNEAKWKIAETKNWTSILSIQNKAVKDIKTEFKAILDSFDVDKLNKLYNRKFVADKIWQWFSSMIKEVSDATWISKEEVMLIFMDSMNARTWKEWITVVDLAKQKIIQWLSDWSIKSDKWAKTAINQVRAITEEKWEAMWAIMDITTIAEKDSDKAADMLNKLDQDFIHDARESNKVINVAEEENKVNKQLEETQAKIKQEKEASIRQAEEEWQWLTKMLKEKNENLEWMQREIKDLWADILWKAKTISNEPELKARIAEAEKKYAENWGSRDVEKELDEYLKKSEKERLADFEEDAEEMWMTLEEYIKAKDITFDSRRDSYIEKFYQDKFWMSKREYDNNVAAEGLSFKDRLKIVEDYLKEKYGMNFSNEWYIEELKNLSKEYDEKSADIWRTLDIFFENSNPTASKLKIKYANKKYNIKWDLNSLTEGETKNILDLMNEYWVESTEISEESINKLISNMKAKADDFTEKKSETRDLILSSWENPYRKYFSTPIANYLEDASKINPDAANGKIASTSLENLFQTFWQMNKKEKEVLKESYQKILDKLWDSKKIANAEADELARIKENKTNKINAAEQKAQQAEAEAQQLALNATAEIKKQWLLNKIKEWVNKTLDFFENNVNIVKKSKLIDSTRELASKMDKINQQNFLWSVWAMIDDIQQWKASDAVFWNLVKSITDSWSKKTMDSIIRDIKNWIKWADWNYNIVKLKDFIWTPLYNSNKTKWTNMVEWNQIDEIIKEVIDLKVAQNMNSALFRTADLAEQWKTAEEIASEIAKDSWKEIKDSNLLKANISIWRESNWAMVLYQRIIDAVAMKKWWAVASEVAEDTIVKAAKDKVSSRSQKRVTAAKKENKASDIEESWIDGGFAQSVKTDVDRTSSLSQSKKAIDSVAKTEKLTEKEKTLMRFWADDEAAKIMDAVSKWKKPWTIWAEFLDWEGYALLMKLLDFKPNETKEYKLFEKAFIESRREIQWIWYQIFHWLTNVLFNWSDSIKTSKWWLKLNDLLQAIPSRITSNIKWVRTWWIIYDPRVTFTKYIMETSAKEWAEFMKWAIWNYLKTALAKESRAWIWENFLKAFDKTASNLDMPEVIADEFMWVYNKLAERLRWMWIKDMVVQDMLNPMFYNPLEYIRAIWWWEKWLILKWDELEDMLLSTIFHKYQWQWNRLPESMIDLYTSIKDKSKYFEKFAWGSLIRNKNALEFWDALWEYMGKIDSLPIWKEQFADWINKTLSHVVSLWDDITRRVTAYDSLLWPIYSKAKKVLDENWYDDFIQSVDKLLYREEWGLRRAEEMEKEFDAFSENLWRLNLKDSETTEILDTLKKSIEAKENDDNRVIVQYLYDRVSERTAEYLKKTWNTPDKFNIADIMNRKTLQESVMEKYNEASSKEVIEQIKRSSEQKKYKKATKWWSEEKTSKIKETLKWYWWWDEESELAAPILWDIDINKLLEGWELPREEQLKEVLRRIISNWEDFDKLMAEKWFFRDLVTDSINKIMDAEEKRLWREYVTVWKNWGFILRQEQEEMNRLQRLGSKWTTRWNVMSQDRETQWILARIQKNKETSYVITDIDFAKILKKKDLNLWKSVNLEMFSSMSKASVYELAKWIKKADRWAVIEEAVARVFWWTRNTAMDSMMAEWWAKEMVNFLFQYKTAIDRMRNTLEMWEHRWELFKWIEFTKWVAENKLANRISWLWNFLSNEDLARLSQKYDASQWPNWLWKNFTKNILYNARADLSDSKAMRTLNWLNFKAQKYWVLRNYNITNLTKSGQQMVSNMLHASWILKSTSVAWTSEFDELYDFIQASSLKNLWFDIFESEWKFWERLFDREIKNWRKTYQWKKDSSVLKNTWLFWKDLATSNALMRWDRATQKWAVKSSLALAVDDIYKQWWADAVKDFTKRLDEYQKLLEKYWLKERDLLDWDRFFKKCNEMLNPELAKKKRSAEFANMNMAEYYATVKKEQKFIYDFYRNEYAPFLGKARTSMGTFFVMDNIKELGSINVIDNNKYMFWLMKRAVGKTWEYMYDIWKAFKWVSPRNLWEWLQAPVFKRLFNEAALWARAMWEVEKMTNHEFTISDWLKAVVVPFAAVWMLVWEAFINLVEDILSPNDWDKYWEWFVKHALSTTIDSVYEFITDRAFIYMWMLWTDIWASVKTADVVWIENSDEFFEAFFKTRARKFYVNNPIVKFPQIRSWGYWTNATEILNPSTILAEIWLNQSSSARQLLSDVNTEIYNMAKWSYDEQDKWYDKIGDWIPVIKNAKQAWIDMWVLLPMLDKKVDNSWARAFLKTTTSRTELARLINNMEKNAAFADEDFKRRVTQNWGEINKNDDAAVKLAMIKSWNYKDSLAAWDIVQKWLNKQDLYWKWESALWLSMMDEWDRNALYEEFQNLYQTYVIDKWKSDTATTEMFDKFVLAATKYWGSMSMAWYMWAYNTAYKAAAREYYGLTADEVTAWNKWDAWLAAEKDVDLNNLPEWKYKNYIEYVDSVRDFQMWLIVDNRDILSRERSIWIEMLNKYIETDKDNFWWKSYLGAIWDEKSNLSKLWNTLNYNEIAKDQWLPWMIVPLAYQEKKASDSYLKMLQQAESPEEIAEAGAKYIWIQETLWWLADKYVDNPQAAWLIKASLASWIVAFADQIKSKSPETLQQVIEIIWEKNINKVLNSLTDSPTVLMADAFELASWSSAHSWSSKWWKHISIPSAKARENYVNKMLIPNYNRAKASAASGSWGWSTSLPDFTNGYARAKDWSVISVKIPLPKRKQLTDLPTNSIDTRTAKLDVAPLPVKEWRIIGWKYSARAIQNSKVYSRRIGR